MKVETPYMSTRILRLLRYIACCSAVFIGFAADGQEIIAPGVPLVSNSAIPIEPAPPVIDTAKENKVKAVYLYSFGRFTRWPTSATGKSAFTIAVVGGGGIRKNLDRIARKRKVQNKSIRVLEYASVDEVDPKQCDVVFVTRNVLASDAKKLMKRLHGTDVLTVTDAASSLFGAVVNFVLEGDSVKFEINNEEAQFKKLAMDARLLRQGRKMYTSTK